MSERMKKTVGVVNGFFSKSRIPIRHAHPKKFIAAETGCATKDPLSGFSQVVNGKLYSILYIIFDVKN